MGNQSTGWSASGAHKIPSQFKRWALKGDRKSTVRKGGKELKAGEEKFERIGSLLHEEEFRGLKTLNMDQSKKSNLARGEINHQPTGPGTALKKEKFEEGGGGARPAGGA